MKLYRILAFEKREDVLRLELFDEMNFVKEEKPRNVEEEIDIERRELERILAGKLSEKIDVLQVISVGDNKIAVVFAGYDGLVGFRIVDVN